MLIVSRGVHRHSGNGLVSANGNTNKADAAVLSGIVEGNAVTVSEGLKQNYL